MDKEKLLYKLVIQFLIYSQGSHKLLEPHLLNLGKNLKAGASLYDLTAELAALSKTLVHIAKSPETQLLTKTSDPAATTQLSEYTLQRIEELLTETVVPSHLQAQARLLRQRDHAAIQDEQSYKKAVDSAIGLLLNIKNHAESEQKNIDNFLAELTENLSQIEQQASYAGKANRLSIDNREAFSDVINKQVDVLNDMTQTAEELTNLKQHTTQHLQQLIGHLVQHKRQEDERQTQAQQQIEAMTKRLLDLETETEALRTRLRVEHDKALSDVLTGLPNRLAYNDRIAMEISRWKRYQAPLSLIIWDIDHFKRINDTYGHKSGDKTLTLVGQLLVNNCRDCDFVARYGGEEFVMLLPNTPVANAAELANAIRQIIQHSGFNANGEEINLTLSCGISELMEGDQHDEVFIRADQALYQSKQQGRNQCTIFQPPVAEPDR